jgi:hypothetical protein
MAVLVGDIIDASAALLNDVNKTQYTSAVQIPYFNMAQNDLQEQMELNNVPVTNEVAPTTLIVAAGVTVISFSTNPALPVDLIEIQQISERLNGTTTDYDPMTRRDFLPPLVEQTESLIWWAWLNQELRFIGATTARQLQLNYIATRLPVITSTATPITLINARSFLQYRTAALCAEFIGENKVRADSLNSNAAIALDSFLGISTKGRQAIACRRRPFMAAYKNRGY